MRDCKPLHLYVSLAPEAAPLATGGEAELLLHSEQSRDKRRGAPVIVTTENEAGARMLPGDGAEVGMVEGLASAATDEAPPAVQPVRSTNDSRPTPWVLDICLVSYRALGNTHGHKHANVPVSLGTALQ